jgi:hypothetical protein
MAVQVNEFVNSKSMVTPGLAGGLVMTITNAIDVKFGCGIYLPHFVLAFSFLVGFVVFIDQNVKSWLSKIALYMLNSFIIFAMASGTNTLGVKATGDDKEIGPELMEEIQKIGSLNSQTENHDASLYFLFVQQAPVPQEDPLKAKRTVLETQVTTCSSNIQLVQTDIVKNQKTYNDPQGKFKTLKRINSDLLNVHTMMKSDTLLLLEAQYQEELVNIQHNLQTLQNALLIEKKKPAETRKFFKAWF